MTGNDLRRGHNPNSPYAIGQAAVSLGVANVPFTGQVPREMFIAGAGSITFKGLDGTWTSQSVAANTTIPVAVTEIAGNGTTTATGIQVRY